MARRRTAKRLDHWQERDPHAVREAKRYRHPIPSRSYLLDALDGLGRPVSLRVFSRELGLTSSRNRDALEKRLQAMVRDGQVLRNRKGEYCLVERLPLIVGEIMGHRDGFGFLVPDDGGEDIYLAPRQMRNLFHGDKAAVRIKRRDRRGRPEGSLVEVLQRNTQQIVGRYARESRVSFVIPNHKRIAHQILIPSGESRDAKPGQIVLAEIIEQPTERAEPIGRIVDVLGDDDAPGIETEIAIHSYNLPHVWPEKVLKEARRVSGRVSNAAKAGRVDLRDLPLVTIDPDDARDFDDAVYCEPAGQGWRLVVAIADVSHYVQPGAAIDAEAQLRGTSVYFPTRVIPMLPETLSNNVCSLKAGVDRLCMVCEMRINADGKVTRSKFYEGLMHSAARLTYGEAGKILFQADRRLRSKHVRAVDSLECLYEVFGALHTAREQRGAIDFDIPEVRFEFDAKGRVERVVPYARTDAHRLIEECMIAANVEAARFLRRHRIPGLYRIHDKPDADKLAELRVFLNSLGLRLPAGDRLDSKAVSRLIKRVEQRPDAELVETVILRSMAQARYRPANIGHFGLALPEYAHFTSPIRRYPDLLVHRAIRHVLRGGGVRDYTYSKREMERLGHSCSEYERRADDATYDAMDWLKCEFMQDKIGEEFDGIITGVAEFGLFVQLKGLQIEGLVHVTSLTNDYYDYDRIHHSLVGQRTETTYRLTDPIRVRVVRANLEDRHIDFEPATGGGGGRRRTRRRRGGK